MENEEKFSALTCTGICSKHGLVVSLVYANISSFPYCPLCGKIIKVDTFSNVPEENPQFSDFLDFLNKSGLGRRGALLDYPDIIFEYFSNV